LLHQLRGFMGESDVGHILLLATEARFIRTPDREEELLGHSYCSFRMPSVLATSANHFAGINKERLRAIMPANLSMTVDVRFCQIGKYPRVAVLSATSDDSAAETS
jgi:hypothetical protein